MTDNSIILLARISACNARVEAMKAENEICKLQGFTPAYSEVGFMDEANEMERLWKEYL